MDSNKKAEMFKLMDEGQWESAAPLLKEYLSEDMSSEDRGRIYVMAAEAYMETMTKLNQQESAVIGEVLAMLKKIDVKERQITDTQTLANLKDELS